MEPVLKRRFTFLRRAPVAGETAVPPVRRRGSVLSGAFLFLRVMRANPLTLVGFILVVLVVGTAALVVGVPFLTGLLSQIHVLPHALSIVPYDPNQLNLNANSIDQSPSFSHPFGTDDVGRDVFSRVLAALPTDLGIGVFVAGIALLFGGFLGLVAGFWDRPGTVGGASSTSILRVTDIFLSIPSLLLALAVVAALGRGEINSLLAVLATWWPFYVRLTRGEVLLIKQQPYITAARAAGVSDVRILFRHAVRNLLEPLLVYFTMDIGTVIVTYSTISYIGIGVPASIPEWGNMVQNYQDSLTTHPWILAAVALAILVTVLAFSLLGDGLRDILDPRSRRAMVTAGTGATTGTAAALSGPTVSERGS